jgi:hypothetical protein
VKIDQLQIKARAFPDAKSIREYIPLEDCRPAYDDWCEKLASARAIFFNTTPLELMPVGIPDPMRRYL